VILALLGDLVSALGGTNGAELLDSLIFFAIEGTLDDDDDTDEYTY
jgi:hypothetical protein